jgi:hypothetical protein
VREREREREKGVGVRGEKREGDAQYKKFNILNCIPAKYYGYIIACNNIMPVVHSCV